MSGYLPEPSTHVAAMGITFTLCGLVFSVEMGVAGAHHPTCAVFTRTQRT